MGKETGPFRRRSCWFTGKTGRLLFLLFWLLPGCGFLTGCGESPSTSSRATATENAVRISWVGDSAVLSRRGQPYFIQGAGGQSRLKRLKECGGNSIRIWDDNDADRILKQADQLDLTVLFGLWVERERDGFNYYDDRAVRKQVEQIRQTVLKYRHHPSLLMWCLGNEWNLKARNISVYDEINRIAKMIHELDPDHPVTTAIGTNRAQILQLIKERCPEIDVLSVNVYGGIHELRGLLDESGWTKPYLISEFGPLGHWESKQTDWQMPIEPFSDRKSEFVRANYQKYIRPRPKNCLGSYVFLWGYKEEGTHTWYSFFDAKGRETALVGTMQTLWTGKPPENVAPVIHQMLINQREVSFQAFLPSDSLYRVEVVASDPDRDNLTYFWEIRPQAEQWLEDDFHDMPLLAEDDLIKTAHQPVTSFQLPRLPGAYRLYVYAYDTHHHVATANVPILIREDDKKSHQ
ncbi:glycoside hydrolase family 2 TIM barrel-domain containing protein [Larkinella terrae]|uniref:Glycoside hydrolase family 2 catalytic domain-containing protein n=1 Tax=Larkinella terrae TaxID=2025311 RepID=A0A7K0ET04_9BACT|nr:glycoside hydrolase family 2 TIM barrel-domain containing protein [Larkinella terrae]MRS64548.1 hypothetical protein [Larkinella terrae]